MDLEKKSVEQPQINIKNVEELTNDLFLRRYRAPGFDSYTELCDTTIERSEERRVGK